MTISNRVVNVLMVLMTATALGAVVYRVAETRRNAPVPLVSEIREWRSYGSSGSVIGAADAPVQLVVFSDFQCPYCKQFADSARAVMARHPGRIRMVFRHRPIESIHPHATAAARAAVCADRAGRFEQMHDALFGAQDSIGVLPWEEFVARAGIEDTASFSACQSSELPAATLARDRKAADELGVSGTPVVLVNGIKVLGMPQRSVLDSLVSLPIGRQ